MMMYCFLGLTVVYFCHIEFVRVLMFDPVHDVETVNY